MQLEIFFTKNKLWLPIQDPDVVFGMKLWVDIGFKAR